MLRRTSKAAGPRYRSAEAKVGRSAVRWFVSGFALGTGCVLGAGLVVLLEATADAREQQVTQRPLADLVGGCTDLALDRNNGRTEAAPCPDFAPQVAATFRSPAVLATAY